MSEDDVAFRRASRLFELLRLRGRNPYDFELGPSAPTPSSPSRRSGRHDDSRGGTVAVGEPRRDHDPSRRRSAIPRNGPALFERSLNGFRALRIDPANEEAMFNLELLIRLLEPNAVASPDPLQRQRAGPRRRGRGAASPRARVLIVRPTFLSPEAAIVGWRSRCRSSRSCSRSRGRGSPGRC